jgi:Na+-transporting methylmalonyl-CoA/oxaloacetate decarboxylase beta subunit
LGFTAQESASIGIIGGADGLTSIFLTIQLAPHLLGAVAFAFSTAGGIVLAKVITLFLREGKKINPCIGAAGVFLTMFG